MWMAEMLKRNRHKPIKEVSYRLDRSLEVAFWRLSKCTSPASSREQIECEERIWSIENPWSPFTRPGPHLTTSAQPTALQGEHGGPKGNRLALDHKGSWLLLAVCCSLGNKTQGGEGRKAQIRLCRGQCAPIGNSPIQAVAARPLASLECPPLPVAQGVPSLAALAEIWNPEVIPAAVRPWPMRC
jgi:hypothetical protein